MPLIIITGLPCSGKSHRAQQIAASLTEFITSSPDPTVTKRSVQIIPAQHSLSDSTSDVPSLRDQIYSSATLEKQARAAEFSAIKRAVSRDTVVVADGLNYIKGYRYQLWCEAKAAGTRCCVVHVAAREDECASWNRERLRAWGREDEGGEDKAASREEAGKEAKGENILGELVPESHTAVYGDRVVDQPRRSRSSSMAGGDSDDDERPTRPQADDTMTLKSLYITGRPSSKTTNPSTIAPSPLPETLSFPTPSIPIPNPTAAPPYSPSTLSSLCMRYEPPSPFSRWDTPLFTLPSTDITPPLQDIWNAIYPAPSKPTSKKALSQLPPSSRGLPTTTSNASPTTESRTPSNGIKSRNEQHLKPHAATILPRATGTDALQLLESTTNDVVKHLLTQLRIHNPAILTSGEGGEIALSIPSTGSSSTTTTASDPTEQETFDTVLHIPSGILPSQPMLQRLRRKYTQIQRGGMAHGQGYVSGRAAIVEGFVGFLRQEWEDV